MGRALTGTVIITGANGVLGSEIAIAIAKAQPFTHLLLTARDPQGDDVRTLQNRIRLVGPRSTEVISLDLSDLNSVVRFAQRTIDRVRRREIPPVIDLIHCAAMAAFRAGNGSSHGGAKVIYIGCSVASSGKLDYFDQNQGRDDHPAGTMLSARAGKLRYASSKLLGSVTLYALRRSLASVSPTFHRIVW